MAAASEPAAEAAAAEVVPVVMTIAGPMPPTEATAKGPVLCREWLLSDQAALLERAEGGPANQGRPRPEDLVELASVTAMRRWPLASLHNLHVSRPDALGELAGPLKQRHRGGLVLVSTPRAFWSPLAPGERGLALQALAQEAGVTLVAGTCPVPGRPASEAELEAEVAGLISDLAVGYAQAAGAPGAPAAPAAGEEVERARPGFLGEVQLWEPGQPALAQEVLALRACVEAQRRSRAPLLLSGPVTEEALAVLEAGPCMWEKCAFFDVPASSPVARERLAARGCYLGFCPPPGAADVAWGAYPGRRPCRSEDAFLEALATAPVGRALVGTGLRFRTDLAAFGGAGIAHAPELIAAAAAAGHGVPAQTALNEAAAAWLQYPWKPPAPPEKVQHMIMCHWCGVWKKDGDHFSKFGFDYCAPKCIRKHGQVEYAPEKHERGE